MLGKGSDFWSLKIDSGIVNSKAEVKIDTEPHLPFWGYCKNLKLGLVVNRAASIFLLLC